MRLLAVDDRPAALNGTLTVDTLTPGRTLATPSRRAAELGHHVVWIALVDAKHERAKARLSVDHHAGGVPTVGTIPCRVTAMNHCEVRA